MLLTGIEILSALGAVALYFGTVGSGGVSWLWQIPLFFLGLVLALLLVLLLFLLLWCGSIDTSKPIEKERRFDRLMVEQYCGLLIRLCRIRFRVLGMEKLPKDGRFFLVCNHIHMIDPGFFLWAFRGRQLAFIAKKETCHMPIISKALHAIGCQPIDRENDRAALTTILKCIDIIKEDRASIAAFPEGYTSMDGALHPFRNGVFKIPQRTKVPIVVCTLKGSSRVLRDLASFRRPRVTLEVLDVLSAADFTCTKDMGDYVHTLMRQNLGDSIG